MHRVVILALDRVEALDLGIAVEVFTSPPVSDSYSVAVCATGGHGVVTTGGLRISVNGGLRLLSQAETVVVLGYAGDPPERALQAIREAHGRGARIVSICTGAFALAAAGLLDGRPATTHWVRTDQLARDFPAVRVRPDVLFVDDGEILTSAGAAAGLDLCLHIVRGDVGAATAVNVARRLVVAPQRDGNQAQYVDQPIPVARGRLADTLAWALARLDEPVDVATMARHAHQSTRHFSRSFVNETGTTPHRWLTGQRLLLARRLLEETTLQVDEVARRSGFATAATLREHFRRRLGTSPTAYRRTFRHAPAVLGAEGNGAITGRD